MHARRALRPGRPLGRRSQEKTLLRFMHPAHDGKPLTGGALAKMAKARHVSKNGEKIFAGAITKEANPKTAKKASKTKA